MDYCYIRAWCRIMGFTASYTRWQLVKARADVAPSDACYYSEDLKRWMRWPEFKRLMEELEVESDETRT